MTLLELGPESLPAILRLYRHLHPDDLPLPAGETVDALWAEICADPKTHYFGAVVEDEIISTCLLQITPNLTRGCRPFGLIENVVTHPGYRRKGYGKAVLRHALEYAANQRCYKVMLMTGRLDESTFRFYESAGFDRHSKQAFVARLT